jgi:hypothetical protein
MTFSLLPGFASCSLHELLNKEAQAREGRAKTACDKLDCASAALIPSVLRQPGQTFLFCDAE